MPRRRHPRSEAVHFATKHEGGHEPHACAQNMVLTPSKISIRRGKFTKCVNEGGVSSLGASTSHNSKGLETSDEDVNNADDDDGGDEGRVTDEARMKRMTLTGRTKERKERRGVW